MPRPAAARAADVRTAFLLVGECADLGDDPVAWREHLFERLAVLTGADVVLGGEITIPPVGVPRDLGTAEWGWHNGFHRAGWLTALAEFDVNPFSSAAFAKYLGDLPTDDGAARTRPELVADGEWYRSRFYDIVHRAAGIDASLHCFRRVNSAPHAYNGFILNRGLGRADFTPRDVALTFEVHRTLAPAVGRALAGMKEPSPGTLSPRVREVLACLLEGDSDKQVAARLGISPNTVNQHAKAIFKHFGVSSRGELLARWVKRRWGKGFAWDPRGK